MLGQTRSMVLEQKRDCSTYQQTTGSMEGTVGISRSRAIVGTHILWRSYSPSNEVLGRPPIASN